MALRLILSRFSIRQQILIGFLPVLIMLAGIAFTSYAKFNAFSVNFESLSQNTAENLTFLEIERDIKELERSVLAYSYVGYAGVLKKIKFLEGEIDSKFQRIAIDALDDSKITDRFQRLLGHYEDYKEAFRTAVLKRQTIQAIRSEKLEPIVLDIHRLFDEIVVLDQSRSSSRSLSYSHLKNKWLQSLMNVQSFAIIPDSGLVRETRVLIKDASQFIDSLLAQENTQEFALKLQSLKNKLGLYQDYFVEVVNLDRTYLHLINVVLAGKAAEIDILSKEMDVLTKQRAQELGQKILDTNEESRRNYVLLSLVAGLIGLAAAWVIAAGIARPVRAMADTLSYLVKGHADTAIPGRDRRDEIGEMAKAADAFKDMALQLEAQGNAIQEALNFQNLISENIPDLIFVKDPEFRIVQANPAFLAMYPTEQRDQVIGYTTLESYDPDEAEAFLTHDKKALKDGYSEVEETVAFPNGRIHTLLTKKVRFENTKGEPFILGVARDITAAKKAEDEILRSNEELERFAYVASHDLQEPLRMVANFTGLLQQEYGDDMDEQARQYMSFSADAAKRMQVLISDLLEYSKVNEEHTSFSNIEPQTCIDYALKNLQTMIDETKAKITIGKLPDTIFAQDMRFSRLMQNLIGNGLKYRDDHRTPEIHIEAKERNKDWVFSIRDNGIGIKDNYLEQIFVIFKRLHHKQEYSGTGIGLAICKKIVESFNGRIWVESEPDKGSIFYFSIPKQS